MPQLSLYNSLSRRKEPFVPDPKRSTIGVYACGPTVYSYAHIGNARMAVVFDLLVKVLREAYPDKDVKYVSNITDVDDKIMAAAKETGEPIDGITRKYEAIYNEDMAALGCEKPDVQPRATEHIPEMIDLCEKLIARGHAYAAEGHVLFNVPSFPAYGGLSGRSRDEQIAGARVEVAGYKKDPADFVLWKPSAADEPGWDSPWGFGRPGWHIECSAMAEKHLGLPFDIHGGGADLKFPHHENEIAQSCCAHGHENDLSAFAKTWVHNGFVTVEGEKMSKSLGNFLLVHDLLEKYDGEVLRLTLLSAHYRQPLDWSEDKLKQSKKVLDKLYSALSDFREITPSDDDDILYVPVLDALLDDLNTPLAITKMHQLAKIAQDPALNDNNKPQVKGALLKTGKLLGILKHDPWVWFGSQIVSVVEDQNVEMLLQARTAAKNNKDFARADQIRDELAAMGFAIEDTAEGPKLKKI
jgi:cysteinyl-tRNA synthetase